MSNRTEMKIVAIAVGAAVILFLVIVGVSLLTAQPASNASIEKSTIDNTANERPSISWEPDTSHSELDKPSPSGGISDEEALEHGVLGNPGAGSIENVGAVTVIANTPGQNLHLRVSNLGPTEVEFTLAVESDALAEQQAQYNIALDGSVGTLQYKDIDVPLSDTLVSGQEYSVVTRLSEAHRAEDVVNEFILKPASPSKEECAEMIAAIDTGALSDTGMSEGAIQELRRVLSQMQ